METGGQVHVAELCKRLYGFPYIKEETDVTIECEGQQFLCHRAVLAARSVYFECMFSNGWKESVTGSVVFAGDHIKGATFLEILKYFYAGDATITSSNFVDLLYSGDYLGVLGLEAHLVRIMLQDRPEPVVNLLEVLFFAHTFFKPALIRVLATCNMTERFKKFFKTKEFLDMPADLLYIVIGKLWKSPPVMKKLLRRAIDRWQVHSLYERQQRALELFEVLGPPAWQSRKCVAAPQSPSLYVYAETNDRTMNTYRYATLKNFVLDQSFEPHPKYRASRFVSVDNVGVFSMADEVENWYTFYPVFNQFASANIGESGLTLASPPINLMPINLLRSFDLCNLSDRGLYLLLSMSNYLSRCRNPRYDASKQPFSFNEIQRGIYFYNFELDRWFSVPAMITQPCESCMTVWNNNTVYVISGNTIGKVVQAYDDRERKWSIMPHTLHHHVGPQSCVLDGKIYVSSVENCERYDPVAARWEDLGRFQKDNYEIRRLMSYDNQLWQFKTFGFNHFIEVYDPPTDTWSTIPSLVNCEGTEQVLDAVIW